MPDGSTVRIFEADERSQAGQARWRVIELNEIFKVQKVIFAGDWDDVSNKSSNQLQFRYFFKQDHIVERWSIKMLYMFIYYHLITLRN
jgi:hypothetical protein